MTARLRRVPLTIFQRFFRTERLAGVVLLGFGLGALANAGIGFTMSLFVAMLAFEDTSLVDAAKRGIIAGSLLAGIAGAVLLKVGRSLRDVN
jgi:Na+/H+ antiporter 1